MEWTAQALDALPTGTVILDDDGCKWVAEGAGLRRLWQFHRWHGFVQVDPPRPGVLYSEGLLKKGPLVMVKG